MPVNVFRWSPLRRWVLPLGLVLVLVACAAPVEFSQSMKIDRNEPSGPPPPIHLAQLPGKRVQLFVRIYPAGVSKVAVTPEEIRTVKVGLESALGQALRERGFDVLDDLRPLEHDPALQVGGRNVNEIQQSRTDGVNAVLARANAGGPASIVQVCLLLAKSDELKEYLSTATSNTQTTSKTTHNFRILTLAEPVLYISGELSSKCNLFGSNPFTIITTRGSRLRENGVRPGRVAAVASSALESPPPVAGDKPTQIRVAPLTVGAWTDALGREMVFKLPTNWVPQPPQP